MDGFSSPGCVHLFPMLGACRGVVWWSAHNEELFKRRTDPEQERARKVDVLNRETTAHNKAATSVAVK